MIGLPLRMLAPIATVLTGVFHPHPLQIGETLIFGNCDYISTTLPSITITFPDRGSFVLHPEDYLLSLDDDDHFKLLISRHPGDNRIAISPFLLPGMNLHVSQDDQLVFCDAVTE
jgi:hypothetical protein